MSARTRLLTPGLVWALSCLSLVWGPQFGAIRLLAGGWLLATVLAGSAHTVLERLPLATVALAAVLAVASGGGWGTWHGWMTATVLTAMWAAAVLRYRRSDWPQLGLGSPGGVGLLVMLAIGCLIVLVSPFEVWSRNFYMGTDFARHVRLVAQLANDGRDPDSVYPHGVHSLTAWAAGDPAGLRDFRLGWQALAGVVWVLASITGSAILAAVNRFGHLWAMSRPLIWAGSGIALLAYLESPWFDTLLSEGYVVNYGVGLTLATLCLEMLDSQWWRRGWAPMECVVLATTALYTWQFFAPLPALVFVLAVVAAGRGNLPRSGTAAAVGAVALVPMVLASTKVSSTSIGAAGGTMTSLRTPVVTALGPPLWWWQLALGLSLLSVPLLWWRRERWPAAGTGTVLLAAVASAVVLFRIVGGSWLLTPYYPAKYMATAAVLVIAPAAATAVWGVGAAWRWAGRSTHALLARSIIVAVVALVMVGVAGFQSALRPNLVIAGTRGLGAPPFPLMMVQAYKDAGLVAKPGQNAVVFGLAPFGTVGQIRGPISVIDTMGMDSLYFLDLSDHYRDPSVESEYDVRGPVRIRDFERICQWLGDHPDDPVLTGPNPASGWVWLRDAGCPESKILPERWVSLQFDPAWWQMTGIDPADATYPTYDEWNEAVNEGRTRRVQQ